MKYCALCCIACDEDLYLREWLAYHALLGFEHFLIYDDLSEVPIAELLKGWADPARVTVVRHTEKRNQATTYDHCLQTFGERFRWIAFLDVDEFIRLGPVRAGRSGLLPDIRVFLAEFEPYAAVGLNWRMFSSSGHEKRPDFPVIGSYTQCLGDNIHIKSVVRPDRVGHCFGPHSFYPAPGWYTVNAARFPLPPAFPFTSAETARAAVNHYFYKSRECFEQKVRRGNPCNSLRRQEEFEQHLKRPTHMDDSLLRYADAVDTVVRSGAMPEAEALAWPDGNVRSGDFAGHAECARRILAAAAGGQDTERAVRRAQLQLAHASLYCQPPGVDGSQQALDLWTLRAQAAMLLAHYDLAHYFLDLAFRFGAGAQAHALLAELLLRSGRKTAARQVMGLIHKHRNPNV